MNSIPQQSATNTLGRLRYTTAARCADALGTLAGRPDPTFGPARAARTRDLLKPLAHRDELLTCLGSAEGNARFATQRVDEESTNQLAVLTGRGRQQGPFGGSGLTFRAFESW